MSDKEWRFPLEIEIDKMKEEAEKLKTENEQLKEALNLILTGVVE